MQQSYVIAAQFSDRMSNIKMALYNSEDHLYPLTFKLTKEKIVKDQKMDHKMAYIMTL